MKTTTATNVEENKNHRQDKSEKEIERENKTERAQTQKPNSTEARQKISSNMDVAFFSCLLVYVSQMEWYAVCGGI